MNNQETFYDQEPYPRGQAEAPRSDSQQNKSMNSSGRETLFQRLEKIASLSQIVRAFGACAIIASMSLFMLQGWAEGNDISRYLKLLAQTGLLTGAGLALSFLIKEFKGARVFFGLALVSVVANFTILGSLTYSLFPMDMQIVDYPDSMKWEVATSALFIPVFLGALSLLSAVTYFGFSIFARQIAKPLTLGFLCLSTVLLIPVRAPLIAVCLSGITLWAAWFFIQRYLIPKLSMNRIGKAETPNGTLVMTKETKVSLGLLLLPGLIVLARAVSFYNIDDLTLLAFSGLLFLTLRSVNGMINTHGVFKRSLDVVLLALSGYIAFTVTQVLPLAWNNNDIFIGALTFAGFAFEQLRSNSDNAWKMLVVHITTLAIIPISLFNAMIDYELIYSVQALLMCGLAFALALKAGNVANKTPFSRIIATVGIIAATLMVGFDLVQLAQLGNWIIIGISGALLIIGASLYERFGLKLLAK